MEGYEKLKVWGKSHSVLLQTNFSTLSQELVRYKLFWNIPFGFNVFPALYERKLFML